MNFQRLTCIGGTTAHYWPITADYPLTALCGIQRFPQDIHTNSFNNAVVGNKSSRRVYSTRAGWRIHHVTATLRRLKPTAPAHTCQRCAAKLRKLEEQCEQSQN